MAPRLFPIWLISTLNIINLALISIPLLNPVVVGWHERHGIGYVWSKSFPMFGGLSTITIESPFYPNRRWTTLDIIYLFARAWSVYRMIKATISGSSRMVRKAEIITCEAFLWNILRIIIEEHLNKETSRRWTIYVSFLFSLILVARIYLRIKSNLPSRLLRDLTSTLKQRYYQNRQARRLHQEPASTQQASAAYPQLESNLKEFRLITSISSSITGMLCLDTTTTSIHTCTTYSAVSWRWGSKRNMEIVLLNGVEIWISNNAANFFRFEATKNQCPLWMDCICINQDDDREKAHQVRLMRSIFENAHRVLVWLGQPSQESQLALDQVHLFRDAANKLVLERNSAAFGAKDQLVRRLILGLPDKDIAEKRWQAVLNTLSTDYFRRTWVLQEVTCANIDAVEIILGLDGQTCSFVEDLWLLNIIFSIILRTGESNVFAINKELLICLNYALEPLLQFRRMRDLRKRQEALLPLIKDQAIRLTILMIGWVDINWRDRLRRRQDNSNLGPDAWQHVLLLLRWTRETDATNPSDKIFAPIGMSKARDHPLLQPDYSNTFEVIYMRLVVAAILAERSFSILAEIGLSNDGLPSWVPDWRRNSTIQGLSTLLNEHGRCIYNACGSLSAQFEVDWPAKAMKVQGIILAEVDHVFESIDEQLVEDDVLHAGCTRFQRQLSSTSSFFSSTTFTRMMAWLDDSRDADARYAYNIFAENEMDKPQDFHRRSSDVSHSMEAHRVEDYSWLHTGRTISTLVQSKEYVLCPKATSKGDVIVVIAGGNVPLVLRRFGYAFTYVGEAYVQSLMDGNLADLELSRLTLV